MEILVQYKSLDGFSKKAKFSTLKGAQRFASNWVGETPEISNLYAVVLALTLNLLKTRTRVLREPSFWGNRACILDTKLTCPTKPTAFVVVR